MNPAANLLGRLLFRRPRALNTLHYLKVVNATTQTRSDELAALAQYAAGASCALEIGTYQGVSACKIAKALAPSGILHCVDPWPKTKGTNPCESICLREFRRARVTDRIRLIRGYSQLVEDRLPTQVDFAFIDGDHALEGIGADWRIVSEKIRVGGIVCLHDCVVPQGEEWRRVDSCAFFESVILRDARFALLEIVYTMAILRRL